MRIHGRRGIGLMFDLGDTYMSNSSAMAIVKAMLLDGFGICFFMFSN